MYANLLAWSVLLSVCIDVLPNFIATIYPNFNIMFELSENTFLHENVQHFETLTTRDEAERRLLCRGRPQPYNFEEPLNPLGGAGLEFGLRALHSVCSASWRHGGGSAQ